MARMLIVVSQELGQSSEGRSAWHGLFQPPNSSPPADDQIPSGAMDKQSGGMMRTSEHAKILPHSGLILFRHVCRLRTSQCNSLPGTNLIECHPDAYSESCLVYKQKRKPVHARQHVRQQGRGDNG